MQKIMYVCDKCGAETENKKNFKHVGVEITEDDREYKREFDICPKCYTKAIASYIDDDFSKYMNPPAFY